MSLTSRPACPNTQAVLDAWLDGRLGELAEHAGSCPACAEALRTNQRLSAALVAAPPPKPPRGAHDAVLRAVSPASAPHSWVAKRILAPAAVLCVLGVAFGAWSLIARAKGLLIGGVHCRVSRQPLRDAWVVLQRDGEVVAIASTEESGGGFRFPNIRPGRYEVLGLREGCVLPSASTVTVVRHQTTRAPVWLGQGPPLRRLQTTGKIEGTVRETGSGQPIPGALIVLEQQDVVRGAVLSDAEGNYLLPSAPATTSTLIVYATGRASGRPSPVVPIPGRTVRADQQLDRP